jgi:membrane-bound lytic murein transglycosylase D
MPPGVSGASAEPSGAVAGSAVSIAKPSREPRSLSEVLSDRSLFRHNSPRRVAPFPLVLNKTVRRYMESFLDQPRQLEASFNRVAPYLSEMIEEFENRGLPRDLVYLAFAESDFSRDGAGPWQLSRATARRFGLHINRWVDERRDPVKSTRAAAEFLSSLHEEIGDWRITLASWNRGESSIDRFWALRGADYSRILRKLPRCTRILLNRFMAVAFIARNADTYGLYPIQYSRTPFDRIKVRGGTPLTHLAWTSGTSVETIRRLNPALLRDRVPPGFATYEVWVPRVPDTEADASPEY